MVTRGSTIDNRSNLAASFIKHGEHSFGMLLAVTPHDPVDSTAWMWMAMNYEPSQAPVCGHGTDRVLRSLARIGK